MTSSTALPPSIVLFDGEKDSGVYHDSIDFDYIHRTGKAVAETLRSGKTAEVAYQPGDWTFYGLVFAPLHVLVPAPPKDDASRETHAFRGSARNEHGVWGYPESWVLVCWAEHGSYNFDIDSPLGIAASYVAEKLSAPMVSGGSIALLMRSVSWWMYESIGVDFGSTPMGGQVRAAARNGRVACVSVTLDETENPTTLHEVAEIALTAHDRPLTRDEIVRFAVDGE